MFFYSPIMSSGSSGGSYATIEFVGAESRTATSGSNQNYYWNFTGGTSSPANTLIEGDLVIVALCIPDNVDNHDLYIWDSSGVEYTEIADLYANSSSDVNFYVGYKFMGSTPDGKFIVPGADGGWFDASSGCCMSYAAFRGVDPTTPLDTTVLTATTTNTVRPTPSTITPNTDGAWIVFAGGGAHTRGTYYYSDSSAEWTVFSTFGLNDAWDGTVCIAYDDSWVSGPSSYSQLGFGSSDSTGYTSAGVTLALRPKAL